MEGCTILGALSVTTGVKDALSIVHGPNGCAHHNFSLLHATLATDTDSRFPHIVSTHLSEDDIIFGGEEALERAIREGLERDVGGIFILNTCIVDTIGDDTAAVCRKSWRVPVIYLPTAGFLGGGFSRGMLNALQTLAIHAKPREKVPRAVSLIGEKNLEYEVEENYTEISRLLESLGLHVYLRFVRDITIADLTEISRSGLNILREPELMPLGDLLRQRYGTPFVDRFPRGFIGTLTFLQDVARTLGIPCEDAVAYEMEHQTRVLAKFQDLEGIAVHLGRDTSNSFLREMVDLLGMFERNDGIHLPIPIPEPVGTGGVERLFHHWRRTICASL
ncbi:MAG: oxidoreductase [Methanomicrobiales archaeon]|nr:oxidoreductase [Methanomicrobiales archaeon]